MDDKLGFLLTTAQDYPDLYNEITREAYKFFGKPIGSETALVILYFHLLINGEVEPYKGEKHDENN